jgi:ATP-dependent Clp protease ATP-binding subunit ClpC
MDEAASKVRMGMLTAPQEVNDLEKEVDNLEKEKVELIKMQDYEKAAEVRDKQKETREKLAESNRNGPRKTMGLNPRKYGK